MPELPDLVYIENRLQKSLPGRSIVGLSIKEPIVFRILISEPLEEALVGQTFTEIFRHGPFLVFKLDHGFEIVIHPMLAGKFRLTTSTQKSGRGLCFAMDFKDDTSLYYLDEKRMGKVYVIRTGDYQQIPRFQQQGVNILSSEFTFARFQDLIRKRRNQVRVFLMDQTVLSAIGNAYADEILFDAGLHPKTFCHQLSAADIEALYGSVKKVMRWGINEVKKAQKPIEMKVRDHVKVRNRKDQPCPKCGTTIRRAGVLGHDTFFCLKCQPASRKQFIDWS
ncbi:DNA-formamidopyrimidine glycosylase [bacterium]|nr:DNA-formamidopyrimidine glycosylase [bacterium]